MLLPLLLNNLLAPSDVIIRRSPEAIGRGYFPFAAAAISVTVNQASETNTAQPIIFAPNVVNQATETDTAQAITWAPKHRLVGQATETDLAQAISVFTAGVEVRRSPEGILRPYAAFPVTAPQFFISQAQETNEALPLSDTRQGISALTAAGIRRKYFSIPPTPTISPQSIPVAQVVETDQALQLVFIYTAFETDLAQPLVVVQPAAGSYVPTWRRRRR